MGEEQSKVGLIASKICEAENYGETLQPWLQPTRFAYNVSTASYNFVAKVFLIIKIIFF
jgi:hypothetical protein